MADNHHVVARRTEKGYFVAAPLYQYDYGQILTLEGFDLPEAFEVHFSSPQDAGRSVTQIGHTVDGVSEVTIPDACLQKSRSISAWLFLHDAETDGETRFLIEIPVRGRALITGDVPTPVEQSAITQAIAALNSAVEETGDAQEAAETAQAAAEAAQGAAEAARDVSVAAKTAAETAASGAAASRTAAETARSAAQISEANASLSADAAAQSASEAGQSASGAGQSASQAAGSAQSAAASAAAAAASEAGVHADAQAAESAKTAAQAAKTAAETASGAAQTAAGNASASETAAAGSATAAAGSASAAAGSATAAAGSAADAAQSAQDAEETVADVTEELDLVKSALNNVEDELYDSEELTLVQRGTLKRLNPTTGDWGSGRGYQIVAGTVSAGDTIRIDADDRWQFQTTNSSGSRIGETYEAGTYTVEVPETAFYVVLSTPDTSNAHVYLLSSKLDGFAEAIAETNQRVNSIDNAKMGKNELDPEGLSIDVSGVENGSWTGNVGGTIAPRTDSNCRRIHADLSDYVGYTMVVKADTTLNPQATFGCLQALCDENGIIVEAYYESYWKNGTWTKVVTEEATQLYLAYRATSTTNLTVNVISPKAEQFAKIPVLEQAVEKAVKPLNLQNLCENANIDDLTGFSVNSAATISAAENVLTITPTARNSETDYTIPTPLQNGHVYYAAADVKCNYTGSGLWIRLPAFRSGQATITIGSKRYNADNPDAWQHLSFVTTQAPDYTTIRFRIFSNSTGLEVIYVRRIVILDLTEIFGAGNEPSAGAVEEIISASNSGSTFFIDTITTNTILAQPYPNSGNNKPIFVGISGYVMNVNAKYSATKDIQYKIGKAGSNSLFNWRGFGFIDNSSPIVGSEVDLSQNIAVITDWFGPHKLRAANNIDGDMPDSDNFTGGNHAYNGDSSGTPTARTASYAFYVDGRKVTEFLGYAYYVDVYWENRVQATNTKKADGTGREVLKETFHMHFDGEKWTLDGTLEPLEALSNWSYYGIQMSRASAYNGYIFYHDSPENRTWHSTRSSSNSGTNACRTITMHDGTDYFEMHVGTDGLGDFALIGNESSFFSTDSKTYSHLIKNASGIAANSVYTYTGWYKWYSMDLT